MMSTMTMSPVTEFDSLVSQSDFVFAIFYRGHWCPFCMNYIRTLASLTSSIESSKGTPVIITAESSANDDNLAAVRKATGYHGQAICDEKNVLANDLKAKGLLNVAISEKAGYEHGMAQPAILVMDKNHKVLESWACVPSMMNLGGAKDRPDLTQVWENAQAQLQQKPRKHEQYSTIGFLKMLRAAIFG